MQDVVSDEEGFTCACGARNEFPSYLRDHWGVRLIHSCVCHRQYVMYRGNVRMIAKSGAGPSESEAFGD